jgi:RNA polymerase sigma-70 factor (family 1)
VQIHWAFLCPLPCCRPASERPRSNNTRTIGLNNFTREHYLAIVDHQWWLYPRYCTKHNLINELLHSILNANIKLASFGVNMSEHHTSEQVELGRFYRRIRHSLIRYASRFLKKPQEIEDVVQEAFVKVLEAKSHRNIHVTDNYLYRTTRNLALNILDKSEHKLTDTIGDQLPESVLLESPSLEEQLESRQRFELFCRAVRQLPIKCQRVFILRRVYDLSHKEIAERMGISVKTVEIHLTKALARCSDYMEAEGQQTGKKQHPVGRTFRGQS